VNDLRQARMQRKMHLLPAPYQALRTPEKQIYRPDMARAAQVVGKMMDGEWAVECHGWAAIFNPLGDHKVIKDGEGFNRAVGIDGAWFYVSHAPFGYRLDYNHPKNHEFFHDIIDTVAIQVDGTAKGVLYKAGKAKFDFTMTMVKHGKKENNPPADKM